MKKKTVKKVEHKVVHKKPEPKKIEVKPVKHTCDVVKEVMSEPSPAAVLPDPVPEPVNLAASLPTHTPGLERC